jgi:acetyl esterase/lipase
MHAACLIAFVSMPPSSSIRNHVQDQIYHRHEGVAFTYDVFQPVKPNGISVIWIVGGGWQSSHTGINHDLAEQACRKGITLFQVVHGSQPRFVMRETVDCVHRAVKHIRLNAKKWQIEPDRIGISGISAGGHLAMMVATQGMIPTGSEPILQVSSEVASASAMFPPLDFLNYGKSNFPAFARDDIRMSYRDIFGIDPNTDEPALAKAFRDYSPMTYVSKKAPPVRLIHGDVDWLVPVQQSQSFKARLDELGVLNELMIVKGGNHGWQEGPNTEELLDWHLKVLKR